VIEEGLVSVAAWVAKILEDCGVDRNSHRVPCMTHVGRGEPCTCPAVNERGWETASRKLEGTGTSSWLGLYVG
jgi:hypothetical protein